MLVSVVLPDNDVITYVRHQWRFFLLGITSDGIQGVRTGSREPVLGISARLAKPVLTLRNLCISIPLQWWILGEANEAVASGPPLENSIYSFGFAQWTIWSEDLFFFFWRTP